MIFNPKILLVVALAYSVMCLANDTEKEETLGNFQNPAAVQEVLTGKRAVANAAWWGFDAIDSTQAIQGTINSGAKKVIIPYVGKEWIVRPIKLASNQEIVFEPGVVVTAKRGEFKSKNDCLFSASGLSNITLRGYGAILRMRKDDYKSFRYTKSEHRHIIQFLGCNNINILGLRVENSGGDGIYLGSTRDKRYLPCKNVLIRDCICDGNYRQGISVTSVDKLLIENCVLKNTIGTSPGAGIDLEPNHSADMLVNVVISNCISENNAGSGFIASISNLKANSRDISILFVNCYAIGCAAPGLRVRAVNERNRPRGLIEFKNCTCENITYAGVSVLWEKVGSPLKLRFSGCKWRNVARRTKEAPVHLTLKREKAKSQTGGIEFVNCYVYDEKKRSFLRITDVEAGEGVYDVKGQINVFNPYGAKMDLGTTGKMSGLKVKSFRIQE
jgi:hypothetical protein